MHVVRLPPERTGRRQRLVRFFFAPVGHVRVADNALSVDDGHGVRGEEFAGGVMGLVTEPRGELGGLVEPEEADVDLQGGDMGADFEDEGGAKGRGGEVVSGCEDGVVVLVDCGWAGG